jgi:UDP-glucose 4-epimerase
MSTKHVVVTGANGFIGRHLCRALVDRGVRVTACIKEGVESSVFGDLVASLRLCRIVSLEEAGNTAFEKADAVIHLAGRAHVMCEKQKDPLRDFRKVNVAGTQALAGSALRLGVQRFIYLSSIKVNGEETKERAFAADDPPGFSDPYGQSKWEAEEVLKKTARGTGLEWVIVRPPLVYGPGVRANFLSLLNWSCRGIPLPLGSLQNRRSLVSVYNLCDLLCLLVDHPAAANSCFLASDSEDLSTPDLIRAVCFALGRSARIVRCPPELLLRAGRLLRRENLMQRLCSSLVLDRQKTKAVLGWSAPLNIHSGLQRTADWFLKSHR